MTVTEDAALTSSTWAARRTAFLRGTWPPVLVAGVALAALLVAGGVAPLDLIRYGLYLGFAIVLPGTLVYRSLRRTPHSLVDDLAVGAVVGYALEIAAWAGYSWLHLQSWLWTWPVWVVSLFAAVPKLRRHWRPAYERRAPVSWCWAVAGILLFWLGYVVVGGVQPYPPVPVGSPRRFLPDQLYMLSLAAEAKHHFPIQVPQLAGQPLHYHWFAYAHEGAASLISHVSTPAVSLQLTAPALSAVAVILLAVTGWRISGRPWVGAVAAALTFVVGEVTAGNLLWGPFGSSTSFSWTSHSAIYGWLFTFTLIVVLVDLMRTDGLPEAPLGRGRWALLALFAVIAGGAKSTVLQTVLAGLAVAVVAELVGRRRLRPVLVATGAVLVAANVFAIGVLYGFETYGLSWGGFWMADNVIGAAPHRTAWKDAVVIGVLLVAFAVFMLTRLAGILAAVGRDWGTVEWFLLGGVAAAVGGLLLLFHPTFSQVYLLRGGWAFGALLSALGYVSLVERTRTPARVIVPTVVLTALLASLVSVLVWKNWPTTPGAQSAKQAFGPILAVGLPLAVCYVAVWLVLRRRGRAGMAAVVLLTGALTAGAPRLVIDARDNHRLPRVASSLAQVPVGHYAAATWLRAHTSPDDVLATNQHAEPPGMGCALYPWLPAYAERRELVGGWAYVPKTQGLASQQHVNSCFVKFWDGELLADNDNAFYAPSAAGIAKLRSTYRVRWLVVNRDVKPESPDLAKYATERFHAGSIVVYRLND